MTSSHHFPNGMAGDGHMFLLQGSIWKGCVLDDSHVVTKHLCGCVDSWTQAMQHVMEGTDLLHHSAHSHELGFASGGGCDTLTTANPSHQSPS